MTISPADLIKALKDLNPSPTDNLDQPEYKHHLEIPLTRLRPLKELSTITKFLTGSGSPSHRVPVSVSFKQGRVERRRTRTPHYQSYYQDWKSVGQLVISFSPSGRPRESNALIVISQDDLHNHRANHWRQTKKHAVTPGDGGLLDAFVFLATQTLLSLKHELIVERGEGDGAKTIKVTLATAVSLKSGFLSAPYSRAKQLAIDALFPLTPNAKTDADPATVGAFYKALHRAPKTAGGLAVGPTGKARHRATAAEAKAEAETDEERATRERREAKGKGRAVEEEEDEEPVEVEVDEILRPRGLVPTLMPFQSASVRWMLAREGVYAPPARESKGEPGGKVKDEDDDDAMVVEEDDEEAPRLEPLPAGDLIDLARGPLWEKVQLTSLVDEGASSTAQPSMQTFFLNRVTCQLSCDDPGQDNLESEPRAGMLCEEVGMGKTVEIISLILLHRQPHRTSLPAYFDPDLIADIQPSDITLVIAPKAIVAQWQGEIQKHAPSLRVLMYEKVGKLKDNQTAKFIAKNYDIVLTTYDALSTEIHFARKPHERALRVRGAVNGRPRYRRSLLVELEYTRVILDEVQMVGQGATVSSELAALVNARNRFAVSSTPLKGGKIADVGGLLRFLRVDLGPDRRTGLDRLLEERTVFDRLVSTMGVRTTKAEVAADELVIPPQSRWCVPIEFGTVERAWYDAQYDQALVTLGLDEETLSQLEQAQNWLPDKSELNRALSNLRAVCSHPQVGLAGQQQLGSVGRALKTVEEVLSSMREMAQAAVWRDEQTLWGARIKKAHLFMFDAENCERFEDALETFLEAQEALPIIIKQLLVEFRQVQHEKRVLLGRAGTAQPTVEDWNDALAAALALSDGEDGKEGHHEIGVEAQPKTDKERALTAREVVLQARLRDFAMLLHAALFLAGGVYFNIGKEEMGELEKASYAEAEKLRSQLLAIYENQTDRAAVGLRGWLQAKEDEKPIDVRRVFTTSRGPSAQGSDPCFCLCRSPNSRFPSQRWAPASSGARPSRLSSSLAISSTRTPSLSGPGASRSSPSCLRRSCRLRARMLPKTRMVNARRTRRKPTS